MIITVGGRLAFPRLHLSFGFIKRLHLLDCSGRSTFVEAKCGLEARRRIFCAKRGIEIATRDILSPIEAVPGLLYTSTGAVIEKIFSWCDKFGHMKLFSIYWMRMYVGRDHLVTATCFDINLKSTQQRLFRFNVFLGSSSSDGGTKPLYFDSVSVA